MCLSVSGWVLVYDSGFVLVLTLGVCVIILYYYYIIILYYILCYTYYILYYTLLLFYLLFHSPLTLQSIFPLFHSSPLPNPPILSSLPIPSHHPIQSIRVGVYCWILISPHSFSCLLSFLSSHPNLPPLLPILSSSQSSPLLLFPSLSTILYVSGLTYTYLYSIIPILSSDPHSRLPIFYSPSSLPLISSPLLFYPFPSSIFCSPLPLSFQSSSSDLSSFLPHSCPS